MRKEGRKGWLGQGTRSHSKARIEIQQDKLWQIIVVENILCNCVACEQGYCALLQHITTETARSPARQPLLHWESKRHAQSIHTCAHASRHAYTRAADTCTHAYAHPHPYTQQHGQKSRQAANPHLVSFLSGQLPCSINTAAVLNEVDGMLKVTLIHELPLNHLLELRRNGSLQRIYCWRCEVACAQVLALQAALPVTLGSTTGGAMHACRLSTPPFVQQQARGERLAPMSGAG